MQGGCGVGCLFFAAVGVQIARQRGDGCRAPLCCHWFKSHVKEGIVDAAHLAGGQIAYQRGWMQRTQRTAQWPRSACCCCCCHKQRLPARLPDRHAQACRLEPVGFVLPICGSRQLHVSELGASSLVVSATLVPYMVSDEQQLTQLSFRAVRMWRCSS